MVTVKASQRIFTRAEVANLTTALDLDPMVAEFQETCAPEQCVADATVSHPEILEARAEVEKAEAAVRFAKTDIWVPDVEAFARYSYTNNVPFLARNFGTFGFHLGYELFDAGHKRGVLHEHEAQWSQAKENLARVRDEVELAVQTAHNKLERTQQMLKVSEEVLALRSESNRVRQQELLRGSALKSQAAMASAQEYGAKALLLQSQVAFRRCAFVSNRLGRIAAWPSCRRAVREEGASPTTAL